MSEKLSEFELIARIEKLAAKQSTAVIRGIGDDAAILRPSKGMELTWAIDAQVEGVHFRREWASPRELGWRALAVNLSDLTAMGARPLGALVSVSVPAAWEDADVIALHKGVVRCGKQFDCPLIGGNVSTAPGQGLQIHVSILGEVAQGRALCRSGAREGDDIWVSGTIGGAALARAALEDASKGGSAQILKHYLQPRPPVMFASELIAHEVHGAIDISDGLCADLGHALVASGKLGAHIDLTAIPVPRELEKIRQAGEWERLVRACNGGEDYQLLFFAKSTKAVREKILTLAEKHEVRLSRIGKIKKEPGITLLCEGDHVLDYDGPQGWQHRR